MATHPELAAEQAYMDVAYERLRIMREAVYERLAGALGSGGGTHQAVLEREIIVNGALHRLDQLDIGDESLCFGRIDEVQSADPAGNGAGERFYIGRLAVSDAEQDPLVVDWRAPVAEPFYRATPREPMGLRRRRHFLTEGRRVRAIEDELFAVGGTAAEDEDDDESFVAGSGALLAALERTRTGRMRDIVATVQREQDEIIRAPLSGVLVVQGGPGTGKTAVALHRAAYLLYTHRFPLERQGVLVVGPNRVFLRYIEQVLPSLGESGVRLTSISGLVATAVRGEDPPAAALVKSDVRMATVVARAVRDRQRPLPRDAAVPFGARVLRLTRSASAQIVNAVKRRGGPHNARRRQVENMIVRRLEGQLRLEDPEERAEVSAELRRHPAVVDALDRMWPLLLPEELLHDLYGAPALIRLAADGILTPAEQAALSRPRAGHLDDIPWTTDDLPLLDEARQLLGRRRRRDADDLRGYGHIVVDEAQDLSPMQLRMLARRSLSGSMTVVGDVAQATGHWAPPAWSAVLEHLPSARQPTLVELSVNYRTPAEIMELAGRVLRAAVPGLEPPTSVRSTGAHPETIRSDRIDLGFAAARATRALQEQVAGGSVAVIVAPSLLENVRRDLRAAEVPFGEPDTHGLEAPVTLLPVTLVKGLEFDSVVVVEPAAIVDEAPQGIQALFVALTRATQRLTLVHAAALPAAMAPR